MCCWRLLRVPWTARRSSQSINPNGNQLWIFIGRTDAEVPILWPPDVKSQPIGKDSDAGKNGRQKEMGKQKVRQLDNITDSMDVNLSKFRERVQDRGAWCTAVRGAAKSRTRTSDWTATTTRHSDVCICVCLFWNSLGFLDIKIRIFQQSCKISIYLFKHYLFPIFSFTFICKSIQNTL